MGIMINNIIREKKGQIYNICPILVSHWKEQQEYIKNSNFSGFRGKVQRILSSCEEYGKVL